ncbi:MAG: Cof-type HAD-IIB family hydrolase [Candidatus Azobacteroides sp.]|nr:Cof-type HAD-IIB family hydrolase [Candidatus Azobacteroides sp.]
MIKAVFFDIDGTLVSFKTHKVPTSSVEAIHNLRRQGIKTFIATGRHPLAINNLGKLRFDGYVTINGGFCLLGQKVIYRNTIPTTEIETLIHYQKTIESFPVVFVQENELFINYYNETVYEIFELLNFPPPPIQSLEKALDSPVFQIIAFFHTEQEKTIMSHLPECESTRWNSLFTDIIPKGGSKSVGIEKIIHHLGISIEETLAFGDGGNDIDMLQHVGYGIAMGNAEEKVKKVADYVTDTVDKDGIYKALEYLHILQK